MSAQDINASTDSENARQEVVQMLADKRAGPLGSMVRKQFWFWTVHADLDLYVGDTYRVVAAARRMVESALPATALAGLGPIQARKGMVRTDKKVVFGKPIGIFEINLAAKDHAEMISFVSKLEAVGLKMICPEEAFDDASCSHILVPKLECVQPLYRKLVDPGLGGATKVCYSTR